MKIFRTLHLAALLIAYSGSLMAQASKSFAKDGLSFNYPSGWTLQENSTADKQEITLAREDSDAQIRVFVYRSKIETPEKLADARKKLIDPYVDSNFNTFQKMGAKPERSPASSEIAGVAAEGVKIRATLEGEPGAAETYWAVVGERLVVLTFFGPDKALKKMTSAWDTVRSSITIAGQKPDTKPSPNPN
jgi:hypothetical protein